MRNFAIYTPSQFLPDYAHTFTPDSQYIQQSLFIQSSQITHVI